MVDQISAPRAAEPAVPPAARAPRLRSAVRRSGIDVPICLAITAAVLALGVYYRRPPIPSDQMSYFRAARSFPDAPDGGEAYWHYLRLGLVLPVRLAIEVFGPSEAAYYVVPFAFAVLLALGVYALGALLFTRWVGTLGAAFTVGNPLVFADVTMLLPDLAATGQFTVAVALAVAIRRQRREVSRTARRRRLALLGLGALLGWSYLTREFIVFCWPVIAAVLWWRPPAGTRRLADLRWIVPPMAACLVLELAIGALVYSSPLMRMRVVTGHGQNAYADQVAHTFRDKPRSEYLLRLWDVLGAAPAGLLLQVALVLTLVGAVVAPRRLALLGLWVAALWIPLTLFGGLLDPAAPKLRLQKTRYWFPVLPAIALGIAACAYLAGRRVLREVSGPGMSARTRRTLAAVAASAALTATLGGVVETNQTGRRFQNAATGSGQLPQFRAWLAAHGADVRTLWVDSRTASVIPLYLRSRYFGKPVWAGRLQVLYPTGPRPAPGDHVLVYSRTSGACGFCRQAMAGVYPAASGFPSTWQLVHHAGQGQLLIYRVPARGGLTGA